jgi:hypothetical protein
MLQIVTGMYFRDVELRETRHRDVFYSNATRLHADDIELPIGRFLFTSPIAPVTPVTIEAVERLEAVRPDGTSDPHISTGGEELLGDVATVFAFAMNVTCSRNIALVERVVPKSVASGVAYRRPSQILRRTFDPEVLISEDDIESAREFCSKLLGCNRRYFETAMRAIKRVVDATYLVCDDPGLAYTLFVTSLESLAQIVTSAEEQRSWESYEPTKRKLIDAATERLTPEQRTRVRDAVLKIDQMLLARRSRAFVLDHVRPEFYRSEGVAASRPIRLQDLPNALTVAYKLRSRNVHELRVLEPELWVIADREDTIRFDNRWVLGLEGLNRLCWHVIKTFIERAPTEIDPDFDYRQHLPGIVRVSLAPQLWIGASEGFTAAQGPRFLEGFLELLLPVMAEEPGAELIDISGVIEKIEGILPGEQRSEVRVPMVALYVLWHRFLSAKHHQPKARSVIDRFAKDLQGPSMVAFAVRVLVGDGIEWTDDELRSLVDTRRGELEKGRGQKLSARFDAALLLCLAERRWEEARDEALALMSEAVESLPGDEGLMQLEEAAQSGESPEVDLLGFVLDARDESGNSDDTATGEGIDDKGSGEAPEEPRDDPTKNPRHNEKRRETTGSKGQ